MARKILVVVSSLNMGGTENHIFQVFSKLNSPDYQVAIYTTHQPGVLAELLRSKGVEIYSSPLAQRLHRFGKVGRLIAYATSMLRLIFINLSCRPDVVHCYLPGAYIIGGICARLTRRPYLLMSRRSMNYYQKKYPRLAQLERRLHKATQRILANSKSVLNQLMNDEKIPNEKLRLIYNGMDLNKYKKQNPSVELRRSLDISENALVMMIVANLFAYKGHMDLLNALSLIKDQLPKDWRLLCVGRDEGCLVSLSEYADKNGLSPHIQWLGQRNDIPELLSISDIGILCSHEEGFSNSVIEGMAAGLPMVVTDVGGNAEAVLHDQNGLVVPPQNPSALAEAILMLALDEHKRKAMGAVSLTRAETEFSLERCVDAYRQMYSELC